MSTHESAAEQEFPGESDPFTDDQIHVPFPPRDDPDGVLRGAPSVPVAESYRLNLVRVSRDVEAGGPVELVPAPGAVSVAPREFCGPASDVVFLVPGVHAFGRLTTRTDDRESVRRLDGRLDFDGWRWATAAVFPPDMQWVEPSVLVLDQDLDEVVVLARRHGQDVVLRWDAAGLAPVATRPGVDLAGAGEPVPVMMRSARTGCPMRCGADDWCKRVGGPWTSSSITAALVWEEHRSMLVSALGCGVCHGGAVAHGRSIAAAELFTPSRRGGWQWGSPFTRDDLGREGEAPASPAGS